MQQLGGKFKSQMPGEAPLMPPKRPRWQQLKSVSNIFLTAVLLAVFILCTIYKMSGRSLSVYKDTSASILIKNGHEFCKLLLKRTQIVV